METKFTYRFTAPLSADMTAWTYHASCGCVLLLYGGEEPDVVKYCERHALIEASADICADAIWEERPEDYPCK
jgi:hypothetical protein